MTRVVALDTGAVEALEAELFLATFLTAFLVAVFLAGAFATAFLVVFLATFLGADVVVVFLVVFFAAGIASACYWLKSRKVYRYTTMCPKSGS